jgi:xylulokinase
LAPSYILAPRLGNQNVFVLGIDIGTGGSRALIIDAKGKVIATQTEAHAEMTMLQPLWAEQSPEDWWRATQLAVKGALAQSGLKGNDIKALGLSGQMHGLVMLDVDLQVIRPSLIWCDQRSQGQVDAAHQQVGRDYVVNALANPLVTGFTLPKLLWVRDHEPELYARCRHILLPKDYVRLMLTGDLATEVSDASGMGMFDVVGRKWASELVEKLGVDRAWLPRCFESQEITGTLSASVAANLGLVAGTPVVGGGGDQAASAVGNGIVNTGVVSCTIGTSGVVFAHMDQPGYDPAGRIHTFCHSIPGQWHVMGVTQGAGLSLQWFRNTLMPGVDYDQLTKEAAAAVAGCDGLFWMPYLMGERTPHLDAQVRGGWVGLTARHKRADLIRAVIEGVSYSQKDGLDLIEGLGTKLTKVRASGGGAKSQFWRQLLADIFNKPVATLETQEGSAYGAALLALVGAGAYSSVPEVCHAVIKEVDITDPDPKAAAFYQEQHAVYQSLYPALKPIYHRA